jgi:hypothetical protein
MAVLTRGAFWFEQPAPFQKYRCWPPYEHCSTLFSPDQVLPLIDDPVEPVRTAPVGSRGGVAPRGVTVGVTVSQLKSLRRRGLRPCHNHHAGLVQLYVFSGYTTDPERASGEGVPTGSLQERSGTLEPALAQQFQPVGVRLPIE